MESTLRWAVVGASWIAGDRVIPALRAAEQKITHLVTSSGGYGADFAAEHGIPAVAATLEDIAAGDIDAVYIGNLNERHRQAAEAAAARGWHVLLEKPMATTVEDARAIVEACERAGVVLAVNHHLAASGAVQAVRELFEAGAVGLVRAVRIEHAKLLPDFLRTWRLGASEGAGVVPDLTPHDASVLFALLGAREVLDVKALAVRQGEWDGPALDASAAVLRLEGDVLVTLHDGFTTPHATSGVEVLGSQGAIRAENLLDPDPIASVQLVTDSGTEEVEWERRDVYEATVLAFVGAVGGEGEPFVDGRAALRAAEVAFAVEAAAR
ncbi:Gfo/Idh/MocA family oxidoreductase [uncultured Agrococcus sp.]|uniref:Gfo/Idh/MocA family protein n=1 Tax=uncultured Agrococcus sp. TaxID=382258 RepID=UPI0025E9D9BF|nr:Gfo/Idh/MocA family oxidoreductase [uncultured Agrococcus sp.]